MLGMERFGKEIYSDGEVELRDTGTGISVYVFAEHETPLFGKTVKNWLCAGTWKYDKRKGLYCELNGIGYYTGNTAETIEGIAQIIRGRR